MGVLVGVDVPRHVVSRRGRRAPSRATTRPSSRRSGGPSSGRASPYYVLQLSTMGILILAANTSFADFPRLSSLLARDGFMPSRFAFRGERLAFSAGIVAAGRPVDRRPGRVRRPGRGAHPALRDRRLHLDHAVAGRAWSSTGGANADDGWRRSIAINGVGAVATGIVAVIFAVAKFALGAWLDRRSSSRSSSPRCCSSAARAGSPRAWIDVAARPTVGSNGASHTWRGRDERCNDGRGGTRSLGGGAGRSALRGGGRGV